MRVLYLEGDEASAATVMGTLKRVGATVDRGHPERGLDPRGYDAILLSNLESAQLAEPVGMHVADAVREGTGLLMAGGERSFAQGGYANSPISGVLPVRLADAEDRVVRPGGAQPRTVGRHPLTEGLPFDDPPVLTAYHRLTARGSAQTVLEVADLQRKDEGNLTLAKSRSPLLVIGRREQGRVAAFGADLASRWSGGLTEWGGEPLVSVGERERVGAHYMAFVARLVWWVARGELEPPREIETGRVATGEPAESAAG